MITQKTTIKKKKNFFDQLKKERSRFNNLTKTKVSFKELRKRKIFSTSYLYKNKKLKKGIFLRKPTFKKIFYPFFMNLRLVNEYLKK
jgi:hypothetical protein